MSKDVDQSDITTAEPVAETTSASPPKTSGEVHQPVVVPKKVDSEGMPEQQHRAFEQRYGNSDLDDWAWYEDPDPATRLQTDRLIDRGIDRLLEITNSQAKDWKVLITCGGVGGEATYLRNKGFTNITNSDFSSEAIEIAKRREPTIKSIVVNAEDIDAEDGEYDLVIVRAGLHHLPRPVLGMNEMIRVASKAVVALEPNEGVIAKVLGQEFEVEEGEINYVFRWTEELLEQVVKSQLLEDPVHIENLRSVHHHKVWVLAEKFCKGDKAKMHKLIKSVYQVGAPVLDRVGNAFIGIVVKDPAVPHTARDEAPATP